MIEDRDVKGFKQLREDVCSLLRKSGGADNKPYVFMNGKKMVKEGINC